MGEESGLELGGEDLFFGDGELAAEADFAFGATDFDAVDWAVVLLVEFGEFDGLDGVEGDGDVFGAAEEVLGVGEVAVGDGEVVGDEGHAEAGEERAEADGDEDGDEDAEDPAGGIGIGFV